jgi:hypothetical protein
MPPVTPSSLKTLPLSELLPVTIVHFCAVVAGDEPPKLSPAVLQMTGPPLLFTVTWKRTVKLLPGGSDVSSVPLSYRPFGATQALPSWLPSRAMLVISSHWMFVTPAGCVVLHVEPLLFEYSTTNDELVML